jgi:hypothetical protein
MKSQKIYHAFIIFFVLLVSIFILLRYYSGQVSIRRDGYYEISSRIKGEYSKAEEVKNKLSSRVESQAVIERVSKNVYDVVFGKYSNTYDAGRAAFNLFADSLIANYDIMLDGKETVDTYTNLLFVSRDEERTSVYSFNLVNKKITQVWGDWGEDVVSMEQSPDKNICFFLTVNGYGKKSSMSYLNDARLYNFNREQDRIKMVEYLRSGIQYYSYWNAKNRFMTSFTSLDSSNNQNVNQSIAVYDTAGGRVQYIQKKFNLLKDGFPNPPKRKLDYTSTMNKYIVFGKEGKEKEKEIYIKRTYTEEGYLIVKTKGDLSDIAWSNDDKYLFFIYSDVKEIPKKKPKTERFLIIYDADSKKIIRKFDSKDFRFLSVFGRLLAIENGSGADSEIMLYDYLKDDIFQDLSINGGCAIKNLPL